MFNFLKGILGSSNQKKSSNNKLDDLTRIYFDRSKTTFLEVKITKEMSCQDIHIQHHNEILAELMRNNNNNGSNNYNKIINANEFAFMIIDDDNKYTEIKLKMKDIPHNFMKRKSINLYYLNVNTNKKEDISGDGRTGSLMEGYSINGIYQGNKTSTMSQQNISQEECIREGELQKYSFKHKKFDRRSVVLDKEKLIITKPKNKESTILLLSDISQISKEISEKSAKDKFTFEISTYEGDHYIFKSKHNADLESWIESIYMLLTLIRDNKFIIKYGDQSNKLVKESYEKGMKIIYNCLSLKGIISIRETRELLFKMYNEAAICSIINAIINYKTNLRSYKYSDALKNFDEIFDLLEIDNFDLNSYFQPVNVSIDGDVSFNQNKKLTNDLSNITVLSQGSLEEIKNIASKPSSPPVIIKSVKRRSSAIDSANIKERKVLLENTNKIAIKDKSPLPKDKPQIPNLDMDEEKIDDTLSKKTQILFCDEIDFSLDSDSKRKTSSNTNSVTEEISDSKRKTAATLIRHLISFDNLKCLKNLKSELFEAIEKCKTDNLGSEYNSKLYEHLKPNIFNEIFESSLTKYFQSFYKSINTNPNFTSRLENILLSYYKKSNKINSNSLLDMEINLYQSVLTKGSSSTIADMKLTPEDKNLGNQNYSPISTSSEFKLDKK